MKITNQLILLIALVLLTLSCELEDDPTPQAELKIYVSGVLSGNPRNNVKVTLYGSAEDAENETNKIEKRRTDRDGFVVFTDLELNNTYWARANTFLGQNKTIRSIELEQVNNELDLPIL